MLFNSEQMYLEELYKGRDLSWEISMLYNRVEGQICQG